jgi:hypothetical protein
VAKGTESNYLKSFLLYQGYRATLPRSSDPGELIELCLSEKARAQELILFIRYLYIVKGFREEKVAAVCTGIAYCVTRAGHSASFLSSELAKRVRRACGRSAEEARAKNLMKLLSDKKPVTSKLLERNQGRQCHPQRWKKPRGPLYPFKGCFLRGSNCVQECEEISRCGGHEG